jgi:hypothetical protein
MALWSTELTTGCFARAEADEPMFVLRARDALAPWLVLAWAMLRTLQIWIGTKPASDFERCDEARALAKQMRAWRKANRPKKPAPEVSPSAAPAAIVWQEGLPIDWDCGPESTLRAGQ